jgi:hypothetical protein
MQGQVVLVLDPQRGNAEPSLVALRTRRDWKSFDLRSPVLALMAPIVDGDGAQLTTRSQEQTDAIVLRLAEAFTGAGIEFRVP